MKHLIFFFCVIFASSLFAQIDTSYTPKNLTYDDYLKLESTFAIKLSRKPTYLIGGNVTKFSKIAMPDLKSKILEHCKKYPKGIVIITASKRGKYKDFKDIIDFLYKSKCIQYVLM